MAQNRRARAVSGAVAGVIGSCLVCVTIDAVPAQVHPSPASRAEQTLPGGATQVQETHGDWRVVCVQQDGQRICSLSQQQTDKDSRQLMLGVEFKATAAGNAEGTLVLPFGLAVDKPVALQIDEAGQVLSLHFRTCVPLGCLVSLALDPPLVGTLKNGNVWTVKVAAESGQDLTLRISLKGFPSAFDRTVALSK